MWYGKTHPQYSRSRLNTCINTHTTYTYMYIKGYSPTRSQWVRSPKRTFYWKTDQQYSRSYLHACINTHTCISEAIYRQELHGFEPEEERAIISGGQNVTYIRGYLPTGTPWVRARRRTFDWKTDQQ